MPAQSNSTQTFVCSLSGQSPVDDAVVTPSGYVCSRRLLLAKLSENGGADPFDPSTSPRSLDESALLSLSTKPTTAPPRAPTATSLPSLLTLLQHEFDAVLLELYDTRKSLEETRRELSSALYQNDAAVRVVARLARERDEARAQLEEYLAAGPPAAAAGPADGGGGEGKRAREDAAPAGGDDEGPAKKPKADAAAAASSIPPEILGQMTSTWKALSKSRRSISKLKRTPEETAQNEALLKGLEGGEKKVNFGKSSAKAGVLCLSSTANGEYVVSAGHDKTAVVYGVSEEKIVGTLSGSASEITSLDALKLDGALLVVTSGADRIARVYALPLESGEGTLLGSAELTGPPVHVTVHPSSTAEAPLIVVALAGTVELYQVDGTEHLALVTKLEGGGTYTTGCLHPDGLIYVAGSDGGELTVFDLKSMSVAGTLKSEDGHPVTALAVSENGYHVASTSSFVPDGPISLWDLRKLKLSATVVPAGVGKLVSLAFDPTATYLAYAGTGGVKVCVAKDWDRVVAELVPGRSGRKKEFDGAVPGGLSWGGSLKEEDEGEKKVWLVSGCDGERPVRFWGVA